jgi:predicted RNA binding protein YcfA (HicA-like mRNA interferase family)
MKLPRDISGEQLARILERLGYQFVRQSGSHARFTHPGPPQAHVAIPMHKQIKIGTLHDILSTVAAQQGLTIPEILEFA